MKRLIVLFCLLNFTFSFSQNEELERLTIQLAFQDPDSSKVNTSVSIIKLLFETKAYSKALKFVYKSEKLAKDLDYKKGLAEILYFKAKINDQEGHTTLAIAGFKEAKSIFLSINDTIDVAKADSSLGILEIRKGNYQEGMTYALSAIKELEKRDLYSQLSENYESLADAYETSGDLEKAITFNLK